MKLPTLTGMELGRLVEKMGFIYNHTTGSHMIYKHLDGRKTTIPNHAGEEIGPGLLIKIMYLFSISSCSDCNRDKRHSPAEKRQNKFCLCHLQ